jgi:hypothetical protein
VVLGLSRTGTLQLTVAQSDAQLTGTWAIASQDTSQNTGGPVTGRVIGSALSVVLMSSVPGACLANVSGTLDATGTRLTGTFASGTCGDAAAGGVVSGVTLAKQ